MHSGPSPGTREARTRGVAFTLSMGWTVLVLARDVEAGFGALPSLEGVVMLVLGLPLIAGAAVAMMAVLLRRREAPRIAQVVLGGFFALALLELAVDDERSSHLLRLLLNLGLPLAWLAWFSFSPEVPRLFVNGPRR
ncbi:MAG: hypothetical protein JNJ54_06360 [Myxococcaceae bacterium]|nr:hypothetical protein [Myxococcaceae bacterium]